MGKYTGWIVAAIMLLILLISKGVFRFIAAAIASLAAVSAFGLLPNYIGNAVGKLKSGRSNNNEVGSGDFKSLFA